MYLDPAHLNLIYVWCNLGSLAIKRITNDDRSNCVDAQAHESVLVEHIWGYIFSYIYSNIPIGPEDYFGFNIFQKGIFA